ncbi:metallophosphoesterase [Rhizobium leguminosarum]|uniref:metallophosphoesterase n=1 Tax=Rhizobium leguminosarum TaxID=384 RepID=UPI001F16A8B6|nr:metallophosphoesterase [Rhizobium leguminosarum]UIK20661.1 metallophosphoesterase [Rhizobium leguminosarum]
MGSASAATFVHLSDIHFGQERDGGDVKINEDVKDRLIEDAKIEIAKLGRRASGIIVTGDIAYSGKSDEYKVAGMWLDRLAEAVGCTKVDVQLIPGNHDIDRDKITIAIECILDAIRDKGHATLDPLLDNESDCALLYTRFEAYRDFAYDYDSELDIKGGIANSGLVHLAERRSIRFVRLNSALICSKMDDEGRLILGKRQQVLPRVTGEEIVLLVHHPLSWYQDSEEARKYIRKRARVVISGHEHFPGLIVEKVDDERDLLMLAAGATNPGKVDEVYTYKYNILTFEWDEENDSLAVSINPRSWNADDVDFQRDDKFMEGKDERQVLASPNFRGASKPSANTKAISSDPENVPKVIASPPLQPEDTTVDGGVKQTEDPTVDEKILQLVFFRELTEGERLQVFVALGAISKDFGSVLDHAMQRRLFRLLIKRGHRNAIEEIVSAAGKKKGTMQ